MQKKTPYNAGSVLAPETGISGGVDRREAQRLRRRNQQLEEENNLLRLKVDILLDMVRKGREGCSTPGQPGQLVPLEGHCAQARCFESKNTKPHQTQSLPSRTHILAGRDTVNVMTVPCVMAAVRVCRAWHQHIKERVFVKTGDRRHHRGRHNRTECGTVMGGPVAGDEHILGRVPCSQLGDAPSRH